jgi:hypothetical protein
MQDDQNGQKTMVLPSADKTRLTHFILSKNIFSSKWPSRVADGNTIMNLPWYPRKIVRFSFVLSPSRLIDYRFIRCVPKTAETRVARWYILKAKSPIWVNFGGSFT